VSVSGADSGLDQTAGLLWRRFSATLAAAAAGSAAAIFLFVLALDPYGLRVGPGRPPAPIMDLNQRFMYPQIVRSGRYDSAVVGTSTVRLLDPQRLEALFGGRFANLGLNAGTPWEQVELVRLLLRHVPRPKVLIFGFDQTWCSPGVDRERLTFRTFPAWLYEERPLRYVYKLLSLKSLEIAGRVALNRLGLMPDRIRADGYEMFVPPDGQYDLARARSHTALQGVPPPPSGKGPLSDADRAALRMPALEWLEDVLAAVPDTRKILIFPPVHVSVQPAAGSPAADEEAECKRRIAEIARRTGSTLIDFRLRSAVTMEDANYWDPLHYRIGIADRLATTLRDATRGAPEPADGFYRVLNAADRAAP
jgi:hypothetical protein